MSIRKQRTVKSAAEVRDFVENQPHHYSGWEERFPLGGPDGRKNHYFIANKDLLIRIPPRVFKDCHLTINSDASDNRMWRWNFKEERRAARKAARAVSKSERSTGTKGTPHTSATRSRKAIAAKVA